MKNMKVSKKMILSFLIIAALAAIVGAVGIYGLTQMEAKDNELYDLNLVAISAMADFRETYQEERTQLRSMILAIGNQAEVQTAVNSFTGYEQRIKEAMSIYESTITDESAEDGYYAAKNAYLGEYVSMKKNIFEAALAGDADLAYQRLLASASAVAPIVSGLQKSAALNDQWGRETVEGNTKLSITLITIQIAVLIVAVATALFFAFYISGLISKPLVALTAFMHKAGTTGEITLGQEDIKIISEYSKYKDETGVCIASSANFIKHITAIADELEMVADGDLTTHIEVLSDKDVMGVAVQKMVDNLNAMFAEINNATDQVATGSKQISDGAQTLAQGSTQQASAVQQLSSSISEIARKTQENADKAARAADLSGTIRHNAQKGSEQMDQMMLAVKDINDASNSINKVIKVIDDIAFQTNILALNAAVEAARAGQHGKGFAVVAEEVRNLAAKSAEAAKDTSSLIENSIEKAQLGAKIADDTAASLNEIVEGINESTVIVNDIARSSEEQTVGIKQINTGIDQVAQVVQQNSATAQESAAASEEMSGQSDMLQGLVMRFKLKDSGRRQAAIGAKSVTSYKSNTTNQQMDYGKY